MTPARPTTGLQLRSVVRSDRTVEVFLEDQEMRDLRSGEVLIRVEATPTNPSDVGPLFARADLDAAELSGSEDRPILRAPLSDVAMEAMADRIGEVVTVGVEGAGTVVAAGSEPQARALLGRVVAVAGGGMYSQYRYADASACLLLPEGVTPAQAAAWYVNPMTAMAMVETMRRDGHPAVVHTAAASSLGQMLQRVCSEGGIALVNVVRRSDQADLLRAMGARHVCNSSDESFTDDLVAALAATSATIAFDAIGGGDLASRILTAMDTACRQSGAPRGPNTYKQLYVYGYLDRRPLELKRNFGADWSVAGWHLQSSLRAIGPERVADLKERVASGLTTTFATTYAGEVSLAGALSLEVARTYGRMGTGAKYLINPSL